MPISIDQFQIEFENFQEVATENPIDVYNNDTQLIYLGPENPIVEIKTVILSPGPYTILIKFYQPNHAKFNILYKIDADKLTYEGNVKLRNCPSISGCREIFKQSNGAKSFDLEQNVTITLTVRLRICSNDCNN